MPLAVTLTAALPLASVAWDGFVARPAPVAGPVNWMVIPGRLTAVPPVPSWRWTVNGWAKGAFAWAVWLLPPVTVRK